jgi:hypothetical protein
MHDCECGFFIAEIADAHGINVCCCEPSCRRTNTTATAGYDQDLIHYDFSMAERLFMSLNAYGYERNRLGRF